MKNAPISKTNKSALNALVSILIVLANNLPTQQGISLLALILFSVRGLTL